MAQPGYKKEERTGILSNIRDKASPVFNYNKKIRDKGNKFVIDQFNQYKKEASDAGKSYEPLAKNNTSNFEKMFGESNFSNKMGEIKYGLQDAGGYLYNLAREGAGFGTDVALGGIGALSDVVEEYGQQQFGIGDGAEGVGKANWTAYEDLAGGLAQKLPKFASDWLGPPTDMGTDAKYAGLNYSPFSTRNDGSQPGKNFYDSWKSASGFNTQANKDRINMLTEKDMKSYTPDVAFPEYKSWLNSDEFKSYDPAVQTEMLSDRKALFNSWYDETLKRKKSGFDSKNEWKVAAPDYSKFASQDYQNDMLSKYGKYDLENYDLNPRIYSPYEDINVNLNLANNDYMEAYKAAGGYENADPNEIGYPTEFDYGFFDRSPVEGGPGLTTAENDRAVLGFMKPYNYNTPEADTYANNLVHLIPELIFGSKGLTLLGDKFNKGFQGVKGSRAAREIFPGMLQYGSDSFGFATDANAVGKKAKAINFGKFVLNNFRRKGGQFAAAGATADYYSDQ